MNSILSQIEELDFDKLSREKLSDNFRSASRIVFPELKEKEKLYLNEDFEYYLNNKGRICVHNTFAGGIIFLREPEVITEIRIEFYSKTNEALVSVEYGSENRNSRNVKYKPNSGKIEQQKWNMLGIFPNFHKHERKIKIILMAIIGKIVKKTCESYNENSWFMNYVEEFELQLFLDGVRKLNYEVETTNNIT